MDLIQQEKKVRVGSEVGEIKLVDYKTGKSVTLRVPNNCFSDVYSVFPYVSHVLRGFLDEMSANTQPTQTFHPKIILKRD